MSNIKRPIDQHHLVRAAPAASTTSRRSSTSTSQACAACRYQRRKCAPDCILAPYFPHDRQRQFQNAHKLFGVSNITKIIRDLHPPHKDEAMRTIIFQSDIRAHDPVGGCYRIITDLQRQIQFTRAQLDIVLHHLAFYKHQHHHPHPHPHPHHQIFIDDAVVDCDINLYDHAALNLDLGQITQQQQQQQHHHQHDNEDDHARQYIINSPPDLKPPLDEPHHLKPLLLNDIHIPAGDRQEFKFQFDELNEPSEDTLFTDANHKASTKQDNVTFFTKQENVPYQQHNEDNDLNGAATLFTLTNCSSY